ncbi:YqcC family protein [Psychromonas sp. Urea-02u-13]|uniref:YqcC family protein n=1 Tax=Psychromonas sp. Urea-02u-13 TaxID=2058326 RepID=UPI000C32CCB3|nr:YqcC family protein [Psychromonas sp. Urea-02u-13]PKG38602.1 hypothetical protein CXF74_12855 [Psychromonas sp. Urea-02u-13]
MHQFEQQKRQLLARLLRELESELLALNLWQKNRPCEQALASVEPFAIDTLNFPEWLQFIFIEKMTQLLQLGLALPSAMAITPMATEYFKVRVMDSGALIAVITRIDLVINEKIKC